jgi:hypothetical protein
MNKVSRHFTGNLSGFYFDDVLIYNKSLSKHFDHLCVVFGENYSYGPLKIHPYFLGPKNFELTCLASNPTFVSLFGLSVNLTI